MYLFSVSLVTNWERCIKICHCKSVSANLPCLRYLLYVFSCFISKHGFISMMSIWWSLPFINIKCLVTILSRFFPLNSIFTDINITSTAFFLFRIALHLPNSGFFFFSYQSYNLMLLIFKIQMHSFCLISGKLNHLYLIIPYS